MKQYLELANALSRAALGLVVVAHAIAFFAGVVKADQFWPTQMGLLGAIAMLRS